MSELHELVCINEKFTRLKLISTQYRQLVNEIEIQVQSVLKKIDSPLFENVQFAKLEYEYLLLLDDFLSVNAELDYLNNTIKRIGDLVTICE